MAGAMSHYQYNSDDGTDYTVKAPTWVAGIQTAVAATTEPTLPKGYRPRHRYLRVTATGKEHRVIVFAPNDSLYTSARGTAVSIPTLGSGTATACTAQGRTGERDKMI
jgi:hypothetical protein